MARTSDTRTQLVTGGTGLVAGTLILEWPDNAQDQVVALIHASRSQDAPSRRFASLREALAIHGRDPGSVVVQRARGIAGDLTQPCRGVEEPPLPRADGMRPSAASPCCEGVIMETHVSGKKHAIERRLRSGVKIFDAISSAGVSGGRQGRLLTPHEEDIPAQPVATPDRFFRSILPGGHGLDPAAGAAMIRRPRADGRSLPENDAAALEAAA